MNNASSPQITPDGSGGAIITWRDGRSGIKYDIYAQRVASTYTVSAQVASGNGNVTPSTQQVAHGGDSLPIAITPDSGWHITSVTDNGNPVTVTDPAGMSYTVANVTSDHVVEATFEKIPGTTWFLAEGCTAGDFETWVLVQNPNPTAVTCDLTFMTSAGPQPGPQDVTVPAFSRKSFNAGLSVNDYNVSIRVDSTGGSVVCERAMYGNGRQWAHDSIGIAVF